MKFTSKPYNYSPDLGDFKVREKLTKLIAKSPQFSVNNKIIYDIYKSEVPALNPYCVS